MKSPVNIIHHRGDLNSVTVDGIKISRKKSIHIKNIGTVKCAPYDNHFIFYDARKLGLTTHCTCGSSATVVGYDAYKGDASPQGAMLVCYIHATTGKHMPVNK